MLAIDNKHEGLPINKSSQVPLKLEQVVAYGKQIKDLLQDDTEKALRLLQRLALLIFNPDFNSYVHKTFTEYFKIQPAIACNTVEDFSLLLRQLGVGVQEKIIKSLLEVLSFKQLLVLIASLLRFEESANYIRSNNFLTKLLSQIIANVNHISYKRFIYTSLATVQSLFIERKNLNADDADKLFNLNECELKILGNAFSTFIHTIIQCPSYVPPFIRKISVLILRDLRERNVVATDGERAQLLAGFYITRFFAPLVMRIGLENFNAQSANYTLFTKFIPKALQVLATALSPESQKKHEDLPEVFAKVVMDKNFQQRMTEFLLYISIEAQHPELGTGHKEVMEIISLIEAKDYIGRIEREQIITEEKGTLVGKLDLNKIVMDEELIAENYKLVLWAEYDLALKSVQAYKDANSKFNFKLFTPDQPRSVYTVKQLDTLIATLDKIASDLSDQNETAKNDRVNKNKENMDILTHIVQLREKQQSPDKNLSQNIGGETNHIESATDFEEDDIPEEYKKLTIGELQALIQSLSSESLKLQQGLETIKQWKLLIGELKYTVPILKANCEQYLRYMYSKQFANDPEGFQQIISAFENGESGKKDFNKKCIVM